MSRQMPTSAQPPGGERTGAAVSRRSRDRRFSAVTGAVLAIAVLGLALGMMPDRGVDARVKPPPIGVPNAAGARQAPAEAATQAAYEPLIDPAADPGGHAEQRRRLETRSRFDEAVAMLQEKRYDEAIVVLHRLMVLDPDMPDAHVNMGFAFLGKGELQTAFDFFMDAIEIDSAQADAYYGIAMVQEAAGNLEGALGGMRSFLHLTDEPDPGRLQVARARSAIWEWEAKLGRGPWGPTRGIPPGFTEEELRRDGGGVGVKMPVGASKAGAPVPYEIKSGDRVPMHRH